MSFHVAENKHYSDQMDALIFCLDLISYIVAINFMNQLLPNPFCFFSSREDGVVNNGIHGEKGGTLFELLLNGERDHLELFHAFLVSTLESGKPYC